MYLSMIIIPQHIILVWNLFHVVNKPTVEVLQLTKRLEIMLRFGILGFVSCYVICV